MSLKINSPDGNAQVQVAANLEWACKSLIASTQQKLFDTVLNHVDSGGGEQNLGKELGSLQQGLQQLQAGALTGRDIDLLKTGAGSTAQGKNGLSDLTAAALLKIASLNAGGDNLSHLYLEGLGTGASARTRGQGQGAANPAYSTVPTSSTPSTPQNLGSLSARFESGDIGVEAIGYDERGGTSYGSYQIASRTGTMRRFLDYLEEKAPAWARRLNAAGPLDTGSRNGALPREWQKIAAEDPVGFEKIQKDFIESTHYTPALQEIEDRTGVNIDHNSKALKEVLWSTAVQHGPRGAANIFCKAIDEAAGQSDNGPTVQNLIDSIYSSRGRQFGTSSPGIRASVRRRFEEEKSLALNMLAKETRGSAESRA